eukprot:TRINITY_DN1117_c0_g1_i2.p1 TRINITY_DN1117_c0_g1~~TRINITY_DN1117_c0_g1_i2.p1  ORF type:complete len:474 (+),score=104.16 TRINITY_DN1117_c0_g1_i2:67-1488(+)
MPKKRRAAVKGSDVAALEDDDMEEEAPDGSAETKGDGASSSNPLPMFHRPEPGENLVLNHKAYDMRHVLLVPWPCMSFDIVMDQDGLNRVKYPLSCTIVTGSQANNPSKCELAMKRVQHMCRTKFDKADSDESSDDDDDGEEEDEEADGGDDEDPVVFSKEFLHQGSVLRMRAMRQHPGIVACWSEEGQVKAYDLRDCLAHLYDPAAWVAAAQEQKAISDKTKNEPFFTSSRTQHSSEGFALQWSSKVEGMMASGDCDGHINVWQSGEQGTSFTATRLEGHAKSVEDLQWSPTQENVLASCSVDGTVRLWDIRDAKSPEKIKWQADVVDINVIAWNENVDARQFLVSGSDSGVFKVWDLRMVKRSDVTPITESDFHRQSFTSVEWSPINSSLLAVASPDMVTFWDFSVERDEEAADNASPMDDKIPPQVMFIHQGVRDAKEIHWHPQLPGLMICTDAEGFQFFKPTNWKSLIK